MENLQNKLKVIEKHTECVILIHGLARSSRSMNRAAKVISKYGYQVINVDYPSRKKNINRLVSEHLQPIIEETQDRNYHRIHFLTHSMGALLLRSYLSRQNLKSLGNTVMLAPPNQGSEVVDKLRHWPLFSLLNGPAGLQIGTGQNSIPRQLGSIDFDAGIIAGNKSINPLLSYLIPGKNDGKVAVEQAKIKGMKDFLLVPNTHTFIMQRSKIIYQALYFIQNGLFYRI